jgi:hypothetical protein
MARPAALGMHPQGTLENTPSMLIEMASPVGGHFFRSAPCSFIRKYK